MNFKAIQNQEKKKALPGRETLTGVLTVPVLPCVSTSYSLDTCVYLHSHAHACMCGCLCLVTCVQLERWAGGF